ncbi:plasmid mobilization protein [Chryseobacterium sp. CBo1]|uniref:plasmid mobilization protein n=1 Tax=Chryseobacterium sp. CBo1 TaxID=1869230 RepID=UPI001E3DB021|nr:special sigma factor [Chryseobacterium sp. CBo1]
MKRNLMAKREKKHFQELGRKGGLKKKNNNHLSKIISFRVTDSEYNENQKSAQKLKLKLSNYARMVYMEKELKINEFKTDEVLLQYGNHFIRIKNLLRHREFSEFENKKQIIQEIDTVTNMIYHYLYEKQNREKPT